MHAASGGLRAARAECSPHPGGLPTRPACRKLELRADLLSSATHARLTTAANPFLCATGRPLVVGHRGVQRLHQENTLAGFQRALELGITAVELDVRLTKDGRVVVFHDSDLLRLTGVARPVIDLTWDQLAKLRIRKHVDVGRDPSGARVVIAYEREEPIALFEEVLAFSDRLAINVELKLDDVYWPHWWRTEIATAAAEVVAEAGARDRVIFTSFDPRKLRAISQVLPDAVVGFCWDETMLNFASPLLELLPPISDHGRADRRFHANARRFLNRLVDANVAGRLLGTRVVGVEHTLVGRESVRRMHERGVAIGTHVLFPLGSTTGKPIAPSAMQAGEVERLAALGVDWIESDDPERVLALI